MKSMTLLKLNTERQTLENDLREMQVEVNSLASRLTVLERKIADNRQKVVELGSKQWHFMQPLLADGFEGRDDA